MREKSPSGLLAPTQNVISSYWPTCSRARTFEFRNSGKWDSNQWFMVFVLQIFKGQLPLWVSLKGEEYFDVQ